MTVSKTIVPVTAFQQNCSILVCERSNKAALVDPGGDAGVLLQALERLGAQPEKIFLTHGHMDHCGAADDLRRELGVPIEGPHEADRFWIDQLDKWSEAVGLPASAPFEPDRWLERDDVVSFGEQQMSVLHCPGHTPGHVVFHLAAERLALVGDVLFQGSIGRTDFPMGDYDTLIRSIKERLWPLGDDVEFVPGHGPMSTFGQERRSNPFVADQRYG